MNTNQLAFFIGLFGSLHCVGMCGPLALAVPMKHNGLGNVLFNKLLYQFGRIISYSFLGLLTGLLGHQIWLAGLQQWVSIISGLLIIAAACFRWLHFSLVNNQLNIILRPFNKLLGYALRNKASHFIVGILNGFLPCGFVYLALAGSLNTNNITSAVFYMFWFGLGTLPIMFAVTAGAGFAGPLIRTKINRGIPFVMLCLGVWFIFRGLELNIPYLSPAKKSEAAECR